MGWNQRGVGYVVNVGVAVYRPAATLPQTASTAIFTISGGRILLRQILGNVTTILGATANAGKLVHNPTAAGTSVDLCATGELNAAPVGAQLGIVGVLATALQLGLAVVAQTTPLVLQAGTIEFSTAASTTGSVAWMCLYSPLDVNALVVIA